jgi:hypothetical protein
MRTAVTLEFLRFPLPTPGEERRGVRIGRWTRRCKQRPTAMEREVRREIDAASEQETAMQTERR